MPFFKTSKPSASRAKKPTRAVGHRTRSTVAANSKYNEEITSSSDGEDDDFLDLDEMGESRKRKQPLSDASDNESDKETEQEKRLRLAKDYLSTLEQRQRSKMEKQQDAEENDADIGVDRQAIAQQLKEDSQQQLGRLHRPVAADVVVDLDGMRTIKTHYQTLNCVSVSADGQFAIAVHRDGTIVKCNLTTGKLLARIPGTTAAKSAKATKSSRTQHHVGSVNVVAMSHEHQPNICVTGGDDATVRVWDVDEMKCTKVFTGHRKAVTAVALRRGNDRQIFSGSADNSVKAWDLTQNGYMDTMYGHSDTITSLHILARERCVSVGGTDRTLRVWKVAAESQLVFNAYQSCGSMECVRMINDEHYVTGHTDGGLSVWTATKKKPIATVHRAHSGPTAGSCNWITALATYAYTDLVASGSGDGYVRLWQLGADYKSLKPIAKVEVPGFINSLEFSADGAKLVVGVAKAHKAGRWFGAIESEEGKNVKNGIVVIPLSYKKKE